MWRLPCRAQLLAGAVVPPETGAAVAASWKLRKTPLSRRIGASTLLEPSEASIRHFMLSATTWRQGIVPSCQVSVSFPARPMFMLERRPRLDHRLSHHFSRNA